MTPPDTAATASRRQYRDTSWPWGTAALDDTSAPVVTPALVTPTPVPPAPHVATVAARRSEFFVAADQPDTAATPGACRYPGCPVLHDDPSNPIHPPWTLEDVAERLRRADRELRDMALGTIGTTPRDRLAHKAEGVRLARSPMSRRPSVPDDPMGSAASYLCGGCGHTDRGPVAELLARMTAHWRAHRD